MPEQISTWITNVFIINRTKVFSFQPKIKPFYLKNIPVSVKNLWALNYPNSSSLNTIHWNHIKSNGARTSDTTFNPYFHPNVIQQDTFRSCWKSFEIKNIYIGKIFQFSNSFWVVSSKRNSCCLTLFCWLNIKTL